MRDDTVEEKKLTITTAKCISLASHRSKAPIWGSPVWENDLLHGIW